MLGAVTTYFIRSFWISPLVLSNRETDLFQKTKLNPPWQYLVWFACFAAGSLLLSTQTHHLLITLFEAFYRYEYLVFGGGEMVVPVMIAATLLSAIGIFLPGTLLIVFAYPV